jgi:hypothetical protein
VRTCGDFTEVLRDAERRGWVVTHTRGGHLKLTHPNGRFYFTARTPSDWRAGRNVDRALRRMEAGQEPGAH